MHKCDYDSMAISPQFTVTPYLSTKLFASSSSLWYVFEATPCFSGNFRKPSPSAAFQEASAAETRLEVPTAFASSIVIHNLVCKFIYISH